MKRIYQHKSGSVKSSFSKRYQLYKLVWYEEFNNLKEIIVTKKREKDMRREKKHYLIKKKNPNLQDLFTRS